MAVNLDIVLLGRSGLGRTTLAKKLLNVENTDLFGERCDKGTTVRVLDAPGFTGSLPQHENLPTVIKFIGKAQDEYQLKVSRVVYFLPSRGPLGKADGAMQQELKLLSHHFGKELFDCIVIAATNPSTDNYQKLGFDKEDFEQTRRVFHEALKSAVSEDMACPPVVYLGLNDEPKETLQKIRSAPVIKEAIIPLVIKNFSPLFRNPVRMYDKKLRNHRLLVPKYSLLQKIIGTVAHLTTLGILDLLCYIFGFRRLPSILNTEEVCVDCGNRPEEECPDRYQSPATGQ